MNRNIKKAMGAVLIGLPLFMVGCGGGGGGGLAPSPTPGVTPNPTPGVTATPTATVGRLNVQFSRTSNVTLPATATYRPQPVGYLTGNTADGYVLSLRFQQPGDLRENIEMELLKESRIVAGDKFFIAYNREQPNIPPEQNYMYMMVQGTGYATLDGSVQVTGLIHHPNADPLKRTVTVQLKIISCWMGGEKISDFVFRRSFFVDGTGEVTVPDFTDLSGTPALIAAQRIQAASQSSSRARSAQ